MAVWFGGGGGTGEERGRRSWIEAVRRRWGLHLVEPEEEPKLQEQAVHHFSDQELLLLPGLAVPLLGHLPQGLRIPDEVREVAEGFRIRTATDG